MDRGLLKSRAKAQLSGRWGMVILACFIFSILCGFSGGSSSSLSFSIDWTYDSFSRVILIPMFLAMAGYSIVTLVLAGPMQMGMSNYMFTFVRKGDTSIENLFAGFKNFVDNLKVGLWYSLYTFLWFGLPVLLVSVLSFVVIIVESIGGSSAFLAVIIMLIGVPVTMAFSIIGTIKTLSYSATFYLKLENPEQNANACITASRKLMNGHKWDLFVLNLSFLGWGILCAFIWIGFLWLVPYQKVTTANFYYGLLSENGLLRKVENVDNNQNFDEKPTDSNSNIL